MSSLQESLSSWAGIVSSLFVIFGLMQSEPWLTTTSVLMLTGSIPSGIDGRRARNGISRKNCATKKDRTELHVDIAKHWPDRLGAEATVEGAPPRRRPLRGMQSHIDGSKPSLAERRCPSCL